MATAGLQEGVCNLVEDGTVKLEAGHDTWYCGIVVSGEVIMMTNYEASNVQLHRRKDGKVLVTHELESLPHATCAINDTEIYVILTGGQIVILSIQCTDGIYTIKRDRTILVQEGLDFYHGLSKVKDSLLVCGMKECMICWCIVSLDDGHIVDTFHQVCKGEYMYMTTKDGMIYISCNNGSIPSDDNGVYGYDIQNNSKDAYIYKHKELYCPAAITVDSKGFVFVCNYGDPGSMHHLTNKCELVSIYRQGIPHSVEAIFCDQHQGHLYVASRFSNVIKIYRPDYQGPVIPVAVLKMDERSLDMYKEALRAGKEKVYNIRVMVVGQYGVGKTTLTKRLLGEDVNILDKKSTEGIDVHIECCKVSLASGEWTKQEKDAEQQFRLQRLVKLLNGHAQKQNASEGQRRNDDHSANKENGSKNRDKTSISKTNKRPMQIKASIKKSKLLPSSQKSLSSITKMNKKGIEHSGKTTSNLSNVSGEAMSNRSETKDTVIEILHLVNKNTDKLEKNIEEYAALAMWDFAGQYVFYTTHQTFLTNRAIYLLVIDLSQQVTDLIKDDECFLDIEGMKLCKVHDMIEIWLNSIHSCTPSTDSGIPVVILVGTHLDKIPENSRQQVINEYFRKIRYMLKDKPTILHLVDDIAIDNTQCDSNLKLEELKRRILELAKEQRHWGEERPARWIPLEQAIMTLKVSGVKVAPLSLVQEINRSGSVRIDNKELDLFLRFQHEIGTVLYFSVEGLREKIMLDPQWIIDALKSLITAEDFIRQKPLITRKWYEFKDKGKLTYELLDVIWSKEKSPEFHDNKDYLLLLMEKLNIVARPKSYSQDGKQVKVENYFLAPCMLREATPMAVISPLPQPHMESSSVLCFAFVENFLPSPIFHRLLAASVAHWPIAKNKNSDDLIYCGCCVFDIDLHHRLTVFFREHVIFARVTRMGTTGEVPSVKLCIEVREFITVTLTNVIGYLGQSLRFDLFIRCPLSDGYSVNCLIPVADLKGNIDVPCHCQDNGHMIISSEMLKFWFQEEKQMDFGRRAVQKLSKMPQTKKGPSVTKSEPIHSKQSWVTSVEPSKYKNHKAATSAYTKWTTAIQPSLWMPSKQINPKTKEKAYSSADKKCKLHQSVLNQCLPNLEQRTTSEKIRELIKQIQERDQDIYEKFKICLVQAKQAFLKDMLNKQEATSGT
ncbi:hypothetical protein CHS0354_038722 [Potamilus streckersoni]|uniref:non-specific serine/threonine protein kinase n=1 Tax=Potamilus streckersoni TaxID=2493646 RepID=A0AAE0SF41_9BIVA|nr:hypothetical protein CHS0354_038722 [Potamilus streckersoni]